MGVRQYMNEKRGLSITVALAMVVGTIAMLWYQSVANSTVAPYDGKAFLTVDDGKNYFAADGMLLPPVNHEGKIAYRANVFTCDGGKTKWVGYLERYSERGKAKFKQMREEQMRGAMPGDGTELLNEMELKRPGDRAWVRQSNIELAAPILDVKCPHNGAHEPQQWLPQ